VIDLEIKTGEVLLLLLGFTVMHRASLGRPGDGWL
jgi:hypothetical protein